MVAGARMGTFYQTNQWDLVQVNRENGLTEQASGIERIAREKA